MCFSWVTLGVVISCFVAVLAFISTLIQYNHYRKTIRPYLSVKNVRCYYERDVKGYNIEYDIENTGPLPAKEICAYSDLRTKNKLVSTPEKPIMYPSIFPQKSFIAEYHSNPVSEEIIEEKKYFSVHIDYKDTSEPLAKVIKSSIFNM